MTVITVVDDFLEKSYQNTVENVLTSIDLPYYLNLITVLPGPDGKDNGIYQSPLVVEAPQFTHTFVINNQMTSQLWYLLAPIAFKFDEMAGTKHELLRCKANLTTQKNNFGPENFYTPHVDYTEGNITTAIYYVNDSDGDTLFFDNELKIIERVSPKKGRLVYFNREQIHAGQAPFKSDFRCVINFNFRSI
jgi:hypothetical protein